MPVRVASKGSSARAAGRHDEGSAPVEIRRLGGEAGASRAAVDLDGATQVKLNWDDQADLLFDQLDCLIRGRLHAAEYCLKSDSIVTNNSEYEGKIKALRDALADIGTLRRAWISE